MNSELAILEQSCSALGLSLDETRLSKFRLYYEMLVERNRVMNLTAITEWEDVVIRHFADSLSLVKILDPGTAGNVIDLGTGAGFPGIPLKIVFPDMQLTLADSLGKRIRFLEDVIRECGLEKITTVHARAEDLARQPEHREKYNLCVSRAVAGLATLCEYCLPFVRIGGSFVAYKAEKAGEEIESSRRAVAMLGGKSIGNNDLVEFTLPGTDMGRTLIRVKKEKATPGAYPRKAGIPARKPL